MKVAMIGLVILMCLAVTESSLAKYKADVCPHDLEVKCIDDINKAYGICEKAAQEKGKDQTADIDCIKYFVNVDKDCWPCICAIAKQQGWKVKGC